MALSQLLDDSLQGSGPQHVDDLYNERHRLALEELLSGGLDSFLDFLGKERLPNFLSDDEIQYIRSAAVPPRCASFHGEDQALEQSLSSSVDCSSVTYFPEVSDVEPPLLEIGWPAFTAGSYRGVTRAVAHFQPSYGENIYSCKEAARRMIKNAKEVIAIVTDSLTDLDIFKDLLEACSNRRVPVYILLDQSCAPAFLKMCRNMAVCLDDLQQMRVRTITGTTYYMRSGAKITGKVHERFMLIDGNRVATGSYRFNWTDGKLNSSNLIELSGQVSEKFDEEFRILYAQSLPLNTRGNLSVRNSMVHVPFHLKHSVTSSPHLARENPACLTSTPTRKPQWLAVHLPHEPLTPSRSKTKPDSATIDEMEHMQEEILAGGAARPVPQLSEEEPPVTVSCHASTQTSRSLTESDTQTDFPLPRPDDPIAPNIADPKDPPSLGPIARAPPDTILKASFCNLSKERQRRYAIIRAKLEHMATSLSQRRELADVTNITRETVTHSRQRTHKDCGQDPDLRMAAGCTGTWPRARCVQ